MNIQCVYYIEHQKCLVTIQLKQVEDNITAEKEFSKLRGQSVGEIIFLKALCTLSPTSESASVNYTALLI